MSERAVSRAMLSRQFKIKAKAFRAWQRYLRQAEAERQTAIQNWVGAVAFWERKALQRAFNGFKLHIAALRAKEVSNRLH